ncbi:short chain dehydrogenase [Xylaria longipes]|nr:short chain dehydrogenase [Xylaria longipes]
MKPPFPCPTLTWRNDTYPSIQYSNPQLNCGGETVVITGAGSGVGRETAVAFATAGAKHILLFGRNEPNLKETEVQILQVRESTRVSVFVGDVTDETVVKQVADTIDTWNVIVHCAAYMSAPAPIAEADIDDYFKSYETNVKSLVILVKYFLPKASPTNASFLALVTGTVTLPPPMLLGLSGYLISKLAISKTIEYLAAENAHVSFFAVHPGFVDTYLFRRSGAIPEKMPMDTAQLAAGFNLWMASPRAKFLSGRSVWANWDVDELMSMKEEIVRGSKLTYVLEGWPFELA